jgi:hypothetical protein
MLPILDTPSQIEACARLLSQAERHCIGAPEVGSPCLNSMDVTKQ